MNVGPATRVVAVLLALLLFLGMGFGAANVAGAVTNAEEEQAEGNSAEDDDVVETDSDVIVNVTPGEEGSLGDGDEVTYTIEVTNDGDELPDAQLSHSLPAGFEHVSSDPEGEANGQQMVWEAPLESGETTFTHTVEAGPAESVEAGQTIEVEQEDTPEAPDDAEQQFTSTACVSEVAGEESSVCASAWQTVERPGMGTMIAWISGGVVLLLLIGVAVYFFLRKRKAESESAT